jgi:hypothetical protein
MKPEFRYQKSEVRPWRSKFSFGMLKFAIRNCPSDSHPSGGFPVSKSEIISLCSELNALGFLAPGS